MEVVRFYPDWNSLKWRKSVLVRLEKLEMEEVGFDLNEMAWNGGSGFWPDWNGLECRKFVFSGLEYDNQITCKNIINKRTSICSHTSYKWPRMIYYNWGQYITNIVGYRGWGLWGVMGGTDLFRGV
jgi:hypothetical protein